MAQSATIAGMKGTNKRAGRKIGGSILIFIFLALLGLFMVFPIYYTVIGSFKPTQEFFLFPPKLYVMDPTTDNYRDLLDVASNLWVPFSRYVFNSFAYTIVITVAHVFVCAMAAYVLAKCKFPGSKLINEIIVLSLLYTSNVIGIMQYMVSAKLHLIDKPWALILPAISSTMGLFLMRQCISQIPNALIEAAKVDGAGHFRICWGIVIPNSKPALMTMIIFKVQEAWNLQAGILVYSEDLKPLTTVIQQISAAGIARQGAAAAGTVFLLVPPILLFIVAQKNVLETMAHSGIKD